MAGGSVSFERAAAFYDRTRITDPAQLAVAMDLLDVTLAPGAVLEIGVGTGALAVPLAQRGRSVIGVDLAVAMLDQLRAKDPRGRVGLAIADATRLPFGGDAFSGAYCRWVLHLITDWPTAVTELCRVVARPGVVIVEPGGYSGEWRTVYRRFVQELGPAAEPVGLRMDEADVDLDAVFARSGASLRGVAETAGSVESSLARFFREAANRSFSWTWRVSQPDLDRAVSVVRAWAIERYGPDLETPFEPEATHRWRVYDLA
jgi:ubiquinone/menaquinone biosynthesis C-methylase UbiE